MARKKPTTLKPTLSLTKTLKKKLSQVTLLVLDVDGVLTDGSIYITDQGTGLKRFHSQDGHGLKMLMENGIDVMLLSARQCKATKKRARELGIENVNTGIGDKKTFLTDYLQTTKTAFENVAYVGDDFIDLPAMAGCGVKIMPANGVASMAKAMDYITTAHGGQGAVREVSDMLLVAKDLYQQYLDDSCLK